MIFETSLDSNYWYLKEKNIQRNKIHAKWKVDNNVHFTLTGYPLHLRLGTLANQILCMYSEQSKVRGWIRNGADVEDILWKPKWMVDLKMKVYESICGDS